MKKIVLFCLLGLSVLTMSAQKNNIPMMKAFDGRYYDSKGVNITEIEQPSNYYYGISVNGNVPVIKQLIDWFKQSEKDAGNKTRKISEGKVKTILVFIYDESEDGFNDDVVNMGIEYPTDLSSVRVFLHSTKPFK